MNDIESAKRLFFEALALMDSGDYSGAELRLRDARTFAPKSVPVLTNLSAALYQQKKIPEAREFALEAVAIDAGDIEANIIVANCFVEEGSLDDALAFCDKIISMAPDLAEIHSNRGSVLSKLNRHEEAIASCKRAIVLRPDLAQAHTNLGNALSELKRKDAAVASYERAAAINPNNTGAWLGLGNVFSGLHRYEEAFKAYDHAFKINPHLSYVEGGRLHAKMQICDWDGLASDIRHVVLSVRRGVLAADPFSFLGVPALPAEQLQCARQFAIDSHPLSSAPLWHGEIYNHDRIRVAYVSADLHDHATAHLMAGLFEAHDRSRFEVTAISLGPEQDTPMRHRIKNSFERFIDGRLMSDDAIAKLILKLEIDIAVDLNGYTQNGRTNIFAKRPAPIQANYLGYPGTMGADYIDYIIADRFVIPESDRQYYSEKVVCLPGSYQANDAKRQIAETVLRRERHHLPQAGFVFCSFNNNYKILPEIFDIWMRLLRETEGSVLWLLEGNKTAVSNLRREAANRGVAPDRLVFAPRMNNADHLARQSLADLFLDTLPYNAHTTAADALWAGLPVVTCTGRAFSARVAGSLLNAIGLPELVTQNLQDYEALALALARDPARLMAVKAKLARHRDTHPLFDTARFTRQLEAAYSEMVARHRRGEPPAPFAVEPMARLP
jgi:predicted O-linked N-acetylglucosamine transferase (SPINDLY family)